MGIFNDVHKYNLKPILLFVIPYFYLYVSIISYYADFGSNDSLGSHTSYLIILTIIGLLLTKSTFLNSLIKSGFLLSIYMIISALLCAELHLFAYSACVLIWVVTLYLSYNIQFNEADLNLIGYVGAVMVNILSWLYISLLNAELFSVMNQDQAVASYNSVYYILLALPFIFLINSKLHILLFSALPLWTFIESGKTTCILTGVAVLFYYFYSTLKKMGIKRRIIFFLVISASISAIYLSKDFGDAFLNIKDDFDSGGNGRLDLSSKAINILINDSSSLELLLGHGVNSIGKYIGMGVHNDFIETMFSFGIIGFILYLIFWMYLIKNIGYFKLNSNLKKTYTISLIVFFFSSAASKLLETQIQMLLPAILWGILLQINKKSQYANCNYRCK